MCSIISRPYAVVEDDISKQGILPITAPVKPYTLFALTWPTKPALASQHPRVASAVSTEQERSISGLVSHMYCKVVERELVAVGHGSCMVAVGPLSQV